MSVLRVASMLRLALLKLKDKHGSWHKVESEIVNANQGQKGTRLDRRSLERLSREGFENVRLTVPQIVALDRYLVMSNLPSLLRNDRGLIDGIAESLVVVFVVAASRHPEQVARADLRCINNLWTSRLGRLSSHMFDIADRKEWERNRANYPNGALIVVGSPVASKATEGTWDEMLGLEPSVQVGLQDLPFYIVSAERDSLDSHFVRPRGEAAKHVSAKAIAALDPDYRALVFDGELYLGSRDEDYAIVVAQRDRATGHIKTVLGGLRGPGTAFLGEVLRRGEPPLLLPPVNKELEHLPIQVAVYRLNMERSEFDDGREEHRVVGASLVRPSELIEHVDGAWRFNARGPDDPELREA